MPAFSIAPLASPVWADGLFPSTGQHVVRNKHGTFYLVGTATNDPTNFSSTNFSLIHNGLTVYSHAFPTNMACIEAFESGEIHVVGADFTLGTLFDLCWPDISTNTVPQIVSQGAEPMDKIGTCADDARRLLYVMGTSGYFHRISADGSARSSQQAMRALNEVYFSLSLDATGTLYAAICSAATSSDYNAVTMMRSTDTSMFAPTWFNAMGAVSTPLDPGASGPLTQLTTKEEEAVNNNLLLSSVATKDNLHALIAEWPANTAGFVHDDMRDISLMLANASVSGAVSAIRPLRGETIFPRCASGAIVFRKSGLFIVAADRTNLVALRSYDGIAWTDYASTPIPNLGTDFIHYINAARGNWGDRDIIGSFLVEHCTPSQWAAGTKVPATAYSFSIPVS